MSDLSLLHDRALRLLARRAHSRRQLRQKLAAGHPGSEVEAVLDRLEKEGWVNDVNYARERAAACRRRRLWGDGRIRRDLRGAGIDAEIIEGTLESLELEWSQEGALAALMERWLARRGRPRELSDLKKLYNHCLGLGYPASLIRGRMDPLFRSALTGNSVERIDDEDLE